jgi:hypothetical protein
MGLEEWYAATTTDNEHRHWGVGGLSSDNSWGNGRGEISWRTGARSMNTAANRYIPDPIIMGPQQPEIRLHGQVHYSLTNRNLFVPESRLDKDGTYSISAFLLERIGPGGLRHSDQPISLSKDQEVLE